MDFFAGWSSCTETVSPECVQRSVVPIGILFNGVDNADLLQVYLVPGDGAGGSGLFSSGVRVGPPAEVMGELNGGGPEEVLPWYGFDWNLREADVG